MAGEKILIVEDQAIIAGHFQGVLRSGTTRSLSQWPRARQHWRQWPPSVPI